MAKSFTSFHHLFEVPLPKCWLRERLESAEYDLDWNLWLDASEDAHSSTPRRGSSRGFYASTLPNVINNLPFSAPRLNTELQGRAQIYIIDARAKRAAGRDIVSRSIGSVLCAA